MGFPKEIKEKAFIACKRHCVLCEERKGSAMECHHIIQRSNNGDDSFDNCIPVCFDCHQEIGSYNPEHPKGNKFSESELKQRRDDFYNRVKNGEFPKSNSVHIENKPTNSIKNWDIETLEKIQREFNSKNLQYYLTEYDLSNDYHIEVFDPLNTLIWEKDNPRFSFVDSDLENCKIDLLNSIDNFIDFKCANTFPTKIGTQAIKTWKNYKYTDEEAFLINKEFNDLASDVWNNYCNLIKMYKEKI